MHSSRILCFASLAFVVLATACGGSNDASNDVNDPAFLPTGTYSLKVVAASCDVNRTFQGTDRAALFRNPSGATPSANIPVPARTNLDDASIFGVLRSDIDLSAQHLDLVINPPVGDACGQKTATLDVTELTATHIAVAYREDAREACGAPACTVEYALDLVEPACAPECKSNGATLSVGPGGSMIWRCECL